ncbi:MAG: hypothetical protein ACJAZ1_003215 [Yoonia sp.]|jgi:hypothetical protein
MATAIAPHHRGLFLHMGKELRKSKWQPRDRNISQFT